MTLTVNPCRRKFLQFGSFLTIAPFTFFVGCSNTQNSQKEGIILGGGRFIDPSTQKIKNVLSVVNIDDLSTKLIHMDFLPHGIHLHPSQPTRIAVFEKKGPHACEVDIERLAIARQIHTDDGRYFYGHGSYSVDNKLLYCTETYLRNGKGIIAVRDSVTHEYLGEFPTYGAEPHECKLIADGAVMAVTNGGSVDTHEIPSVTYIDVKTQKLIKKETLTNDTLNTGHMAIGEDGSLVVISAPRTMTTTPFLGGVSIRLRGDKLITLSAPEHIVSNMKGEALSVAIQNEKRIAAVTHPDGNMVTFWSIPDRTLLHSIRLEAPRGISLSNDKQYFLIGYGKKPKIRKIPVDNLKSDELHVIEDTFISGSHIYNWSHEFKEILYPGPLI